MTVPPNMDFLSREEHFQRMARQARRITEDMADAIQKAKSEAWTACSNAHLEYQLSGDIALLDDPYAKKENQG